MKRSDQLTEWATEMFDLLVANPYGLTRDQIMANLGIPEVGDFHEAKGVLQDICGATDSITIVGDSRTAMLGGWTYSLQADPNNAEAKGYQVRKLKGLFGRQCRSYMVAKSLQKGTSKKTAVGKTVDRMVRSIRNSMEETAAALDELGVFVTVPPP